MSLRHFLDEAAKGLPASSYLLVSEDPFLLREAATAAAGVLSEAERGFGLSTLDLSGEEKVSLAAVCDVLNTAPFFGGRRIVIVEGAQDIAKKEADRLQSYFINPSPSSVLVLLHRGTPKAHLRDLGQGVSVIGLDLRPQDLPRWLKERARQKNLALTDRAIEFLLGTIGPDVGLLSSELEKCLLLDKRPLDAEDVADVVSGNREYTAFNLVDAIRERNGDKVFTIARELQATTDAYGILGAVNWHYGKLASSGRGEPAALNKVFGLLHAADKGIKTSGGAYPLEYLLIRLMRTI